MHLAFEEVSYAYGEPDTKRKRHRLKKKRKADDLQGAAQGNGGGDGWALRNLSFTVEAGEFFGVAGPTGSGKSTLLQHMNGLLHPTRGRVLLDGEDVADATIAARVRCSIGVLFQYPEHQLFANTVYDDVAFGPRNLMLGEDEVDERVKCALATVGLDAAEFAQRSPFSLSGGQQRRVAFAGVLAMSPQVLVLDEPMAGLDPAARTDFLGLIERLHADGLTVVMVSHSMEDLAHFCDRVLVLLEGCLFALGTPEEVFADVSALDSIGLAVPAAQNLAISLRREGFDLRRELYDEEALADDIALQLACVQSF